MNHKSPHNNNHCKSVQQSNEMEPQTDNNFKRDSKILSISAEIFQRSSSHAQHLRPCRALPQPPGLSRETAHFPLCHCEGRCLSDRLRLHSLAFQVCVACKQMVCGLSNGVILRDCDCHIRQSTSDEYRLRSYSVECTGSRPIT